MKKRDQDFKGYNIQQPIPDYFLPELKSNNNFKKSFYGRFTKDKKERLNSLVKQH